MKQRKMDFLVAMTYIGAVVGAGFASGQELWQFFARWGFSGWLGILLAGLLFALAGGNLWLAKSSGAFAGHFAGAAGLAFGRCPVCFFIGHAGGDAFCHGCFGAGAVSAPRLLGHFGVLAVALATAQERIRQIVEVAKRVGATADPIGGGGGRHWAGLRSLAASRNRCALGPKPRALAGALVWPAVCGL